MASYIGSHEGFVGYAYPDSNQIPTIGYGYNLQQSGTQGTVDGILGAGTYQKLMDRFSRLKTTWLNTYGNLTDFAYGTPRYLTFSGNNPSLVTQVISPTGGTMLLNTILPGYVASAALLGTATYNAMSPAAQNAIVDIIYNRGATAFGQTMANIVTDLQGHNYAMAAWDLMNDVTRSSSVWATVVGNRANDDLIALAWGHETELVSYS